MFLTIVFPAYDEEKKIKDDILRASEFLTSNNIAGEIIVVDDGSKDRTYETAVSTTTLINQKLRVIKHKNNLGKGAAVKSGVMEASGEFILYSDVGNIIPFNYALNGIDSLKNNKAEIANGSRKLPDSIILKEQGTDRIIASKYFNWLIRISLNIPSYLTDTQCGFKIYRNKIGKKLFSLLETNGFLFELEIILRAIEQDYKLIEFPVEWRCDRDSRINILNTAPKIIGEIKSLRKMFN